MIEKGSMFKAWEATTEQQKKAHEMQAIYKAQETARQAIQEVMNRYIKKKTRARSVAKAEADPFAELEGWESLEQIQEAYGYGEITSDRRDKLTDLPPGQVDGPVGGQRGRTAQGKERWQISRPCNRYAGPCYSQRGH